MSSTHSYPLASLNRSVSCDSQSLHASESTQLFRLPFAMPPLPSPPSSDSASTPGTPRGSANPSVLSPSAKGLIAKRDEDTFASPSLPLPRSHCNTTPFETPPTIRRRQSEISVRSASSCSSQNSTPMFNISHRQHGKGTSTAPSPSSPLTPEFRVAKQDKENEHTHDAVLSEKDQRIRDLESRLKVVVQLLPTFSDTSDTHTMNTNSNTSSTTIPAPSSGTDEATPETTMTALAARVARLERERADLELRNQTLTARLANKTDECTQLSDALSSAHAANTAATRVLSNAGMWSEGQGLAEAVQGLVSRTAERERDLAKAQKQCSQLVERVALLDKLKRVENKVEVRLCHSKREQTALRQTVAELEERLRVAESGSRKGMTAVAGDKEEVLHCTHDIKHLLTILRTLYPHIMPPALAPNPLTPFPSERASSSASNPAARANSRLRSRRGGPSTRNPSPVKARRVSELVKVREELASIRNHLLASSEKDEIRVPVQRTRSAVAPFMTMGSM